MATLESLSEALTSLNETVSAYEEEVFSGFYSTTDANNAWMLQSGYLVFFMQAGFAMLCAGAVRAKNAKNIILLNLLDACFGCLSWYALGWGFAYGDPSADEEGNYDFSTSQAFIGNRFFFMADFPRSLYALWFFQFTFAATAATIVSGAVAERCKFQAYICYEIMLVCFVYPVVAHWVWSTFGFMSATRSAATSAQDYTLFFGTGVYDFAGDGPVHMVGGFASLAAAWVLGPRIGRYDATGAAVDMPGHNASLTLLGVFFLWFGWYGFNPGSLLAIAGVSDLAAAVAINTTIAAASGTISTLFIAMIHQYSTTGLVVWDLLIAGNGALAGLVGITGGANLMNTWAALLTGAIAGGVYFVASKINLHVLKIDDPLDAIAVHAGCGAWGMIATSCFAASNLVEGYYSGYPTDSPRAYGFIMGGGSGGGKLLAAHIVYILIIASWSLAIMTPFFLLLKKAGLFRVAPEVEAAGLDVSHHGGSAYPYENDKGGAKPGEVYLTSEMVDRKIEEALAKAAPKSV